MWHLWWTEEVSAGFCLGNLRERDHFKDLGMDGKVMLQRISKKRVRGVDWIDLAQDRDKWRAFVNAVVKLLVP